MTWYQAPEDSENVIGSKNYWAGRTGREYPPAPTYREVDGKTRLGRYMDPWGCQEHMTGAKKAWRHAYLTFYIVGGISLFTAEVDWFVLLVIYPFIFACYFWAKKQWRDKYFFYKDVQTRINETGEPQWVPYDKDRLKMIEREPRAILP
jgi:hypothetical protein